MFSPGPSIVSITGRIRGSGQGFQEIGQAYGPFDLSMLEIGAFDPHVGGYPYGAGWSGEKFSRHGRHGIDDADPLGIVRLALHGWRQPIERYLPLRVEDLGSRARDAHGVVSGDGVTVGVVAAINYCALMVPQACQFILSSLSSLGNHPCSRSGPGKPTLSQLEESMAAERITFIIRAWTRSTARTCITLQVVWTFDSGDQHPKSEMECNPIVVDGVLYATTPNGERGRAGRGDRQCALAVRRYRGSQEYWQGAQPGGDVLGRRSKIGASLWGTAISVSLDAATGKPSPPLAKGDVVDLREGLGREPLELGDDDQPCRGVQGPGNRRRCE